MILEWVYRCWYSIYNKHITDLLINVNAVCIIFFSNFTYFSVVFLIKMMAKNVCNVAVPVNRSCRLGMIVLQLWRHPVGSPLSKPLVTAENQLATWQIMSASRFWYSVLLRTDFSYFIWILIASSTSAWLRSTFDLINFCRLCKM